MFLYMEISPFMSPEIVQMLGERINLQQLKHVTWSENRGLDVVKLELGLHACQDLVYSVAYTLEGLLKATSKVAASLVAFKQADVRRAGKRKAR